METGVNAVVVKYGLDPEVWVPIFIQYKLTSDAAIQVNIHDEQLFKDICSQTNKQHEINILKGIFKVPSTEISEKETELINKLEAEGLNSTYWLPKLEAKLSITSINSLNHVSEEDLHQLANFVTKPWESRALRKIFGLPNEKDSLKEARSAQKKKNEEKQAKLQKSFEELQKLSASGKERTEKDVKELEDKLKGLLDVPETYWISQNESLSGLVKVLEEKIKPPDELTVDSDKAELTDKELLHNSSSGLAFKGILLSKKTEEHSLSNEFLIDTTCQVSLRGPSLSQQYKTEEFSSQHQESHFEKNVSSLGLMAATSVKGGIGGFGFKATSSVQSSNQSESEMHRESKETYLSTKKYCFIPLASCYFEKKCIKLSQNVLDELKVIERERNNQIAEEKCMALFKEYGSHANKGPIHFGGVYVWTSCIQGFTASQKSKAKHLTAEALDLHAAASYMGVSGSADISAKHYEGQFKGNYTADLMHKAKLNITKIGGPATDSTLQWKAGLISNNRTWQVIDRGDNFISIWEIIAANHQVDFHDFQHMCKILVDAYSTLTGFDADLSFWRCDKESMIEKMKKSVEEWDNTNASVKLLKLCEWKNTLLQGKDGYDCWVHFLSETILQRFVVQVITKAENEEVNDLGYVKILLQDLLSEYISSITSFEGKTLVYNFICETKYLETTDTEASTLSTFEDMKALLDTCYDMLSQQNTTHEQIKVKQLLTQKVYSLRCHFKSSNQYLLEMFLVQCLELYGYIEDEDLFICLVEPWDIKSLAQKMNQGYLKLTSLKEESLEKAEAFVLLNALIFAEGDSAKMTAQYRSDKLNAMKRKWYAPHFQTKVKDVVMSFPEDYVDIDDLQSHLDCIVNGIPYHKSLQLEDLRGNMENLLNESIQQSSSLQRKSDNGMCEAKAVPEILSTIKSRLGLQKEQLTMKDALIVDVDKVSEKPPTEERELVSYLLQKLMKIDSRAPHYYIKNQSKTVKEDMQSSDIQDDPFEDPSDNMENEDATAKVSQLHPIDVLLTLIASSDMLLQQYLFTKLAMCQIALPIVTLNPNGELTFMLWATRMIKKSWKSTTKNGPPQCYDRSISTVPTFFVSFIKLDSQSVSKSKIINCLVNDQNHNTFYNRDCEGSPKERKLLNGVIEMCWFLPSGEHTDKFADIVSVLNLRGDVRHREQQLQYLRKISNVIVVLTSKEDFNNVSADVKATFRDFLVDGTKKLICLFTDKGEPQASSKNIARLAIKGKNVADIAAMLQTELLQTIENTGNNLKMSLETCAERARESGISVDEDDSHCKKAQLHASNLVGLIEDKEVLQFKNEALPLQGHLWKKWCQLEKQLCRIEDTGTETIEQRRCHIEQNKKSIRAEQLKKANSLHPFMKTFMEILTAEEHLVREFFMTWLAYFLDLKSQQQLPKMHQQYHKMWQDISGSEEKMAMKTHEKTTKLNQMDKKISDSSLGIEHVMRELGQIYGAVTDMDFHISGSEKLPSIAAEMLVAGHPVELMDGDAAHVPTTWVSAVLDKTAAMLGDPKIFILSVLGIQSTGKSTLLNTMFGLRFAVSSGRCTRGAFMQLLSVKGTHQQKHFDYILVVDTEGLRAPEIANISTNKHDNELATFVIGIGDVTMINIFGENPADIEDILQITVQAILRMNTVSLKPQCFFVHQNVGDLNISNRTISARRKLQERLDKMTAVAAEQEHREVVSFSEVIQFDIEQDVAYISGLWKGDPPMAPPNHGYSEKIEQLESKLIQIPKKNCMRISNFKTRIKDLWTALLHENFVFSFKNSLEISVYCKLEKEYAVWRWELHDFRLQVEQSVRRKIQNEVTVSNNLLSEMEGDIEKKINFKAVEIQQKIEEFFDSSEEKDTLVNWRQGIFDKFENLRIKLFTQIQQVCKECIEKRKAMQQLDSENLKYEQKMLSKAKVLATGLQGKQLTENQLEEEFRQIWQEIIASLPYDRGVEQDVHILIDAERILYQDIFARQHARLKEQLHNGAPLAKHLTFHTDPKHHIKSGVFSSPSQKEIKRVEELVNTITANLNKFLSEKTTDNKDYNDSYFLSIIHDMNKTIGEFEKSSKITLKPEFKVDLALVLFGTAIHIFEFIHATYVYKTSPKKYLENKKPGYFKAFKKLYHGAEAGTIAADFFTESLKSSLENTVKNDIGRIIAGELKSTETAFNGNKAKFETCLLIDLAEKECFEDYKMYIQRPSQYFENFIHCCISKYCFSHQRGIPYVHHVINRVLDDLKRDLCTAVSKATRNTLEKNADIQTWGEECRKEMNDRIDIRECILRINDQEVGSSELSIFNENVLKIITKLVEELKAETKNVNEDVLMQWKPNALDILKEQLGGCLDSCPFCNAVCTNTIEGHDGKHSVPFHRPEGLTGTVWENNKKLSLDICSSAISSNYRFVAFLSDGKWYQYKDYRNAGAPYSKWSITPDTSLQKYWKWVVCHFQREWEEEYLTKFTTIPDDWKKVEKDTIKEELKKMI